MAKLKKRNDGFFRAWYKGKQFLGKTEAEAKAKRDEYKYECEHGIDRVELITLFDFAEKWLPVAKANVTRNTYNFYTHLLEILTDICGEKQISAVRPSDIKLAWKEMLGKSQAYINTAHHLYTAMFNSAVEEGYCRSNPMFTNTAKPHKGTKGTHRCLTDEEINLIETTPHRMQPVAMFMLKAGLRRGEVLALQKEDIHDDRIWVTKAVKFDVNAPEVGSTKNESSKRSVPLFAPLKPFADGIGKHMLSTRNGSLVTRRSFDQCWKSYMYCLSQKAGHEIKFRSHDCRHTFITKARDKGIDIHIVMDWVGHSSERMILRIYDHPSESREANAIAIMEQ
ncbi:MAG: site-specific integrase [Treponema sp.]|nr:site-specific integrase [Treponema sp.]